MISGRETQRLLQGSACCGPNYHGRLLSAITPRRLRWESRWRMRSTLDVMTGAKVDRLCQPLGVRRKARLSPGCVCMCSSVRNGCDKESGSPRAHLPASTSMSRGGGARRSGGSGCGPSVLSGRLRIHLLVTWRKWGRGRQPIATQTVLPVALPCHTTMTGSRHDTECGGTSSRNGRLDAA
jgi:hypothetical protein